MSCRRHTSRQRGKTSLEIQLVPFARARGLELAGGQLDDLTLKELNVTRQQESAAVGATATEDSEAGNTETGG